MRLFFLISCALASTAFAQSDPKVHAMTTQPPAARFEIVQSTVAARWTFRLDRYTGEVHQIVETEDGDLNLAVDGNAGVIQHTEVQQT